MSAQPVLIEPESPRLEPRQALRSELWVAKALGRRDLFAVGVSTLEQRAGILRAYLLGHELGDVTVTTPRGRVSTWAAVFEAIYGEPLGECP